MLYVVTKGEYSDCYTCGIFSTLEKAEDARVFYATDNSIEEYELDSLPDRPARTVGWVVVMQENGNIVDAGQRDDVVGYVPFYQYWQPTGDNCSIRFEMWARDREHAIKIANDRRAQLIASDEWTVDRNEWSKRNG